MQLIHTVDGYMLPVKVEDEFMICEIGGQCNYHECNGRFIDFIAGERDMFDF